MCGGSDGVETCKKVMLDTCNEELDAEVLQEVNDSGSPTPKRSMFQFSNC